MAFPFVKMKAQHIKQSKHKKAKVPPPPPKSKKTKGGLGPSINLMNMLGK
jgi:hypothetical protein